VPLFGRSVRFLAPFVLAVIVALTIQATVARLYEVRQSSMERTLSEGDVLLGERLTPRFGTLSHGDVVIFSVTTGPFAGQPLVKRVVGLPGDTVELRDGVVFRNGRPLDEPYINSFAGRTDPLVAGATSWLLAEGTYFLLGDHRDGSVDSRAFGPVPLTAIEARVMFRVSPFGGFDAP
jgi:signal peptidase I